MRRPVLECVRDHLRRRRDGQHAPPVPAASEPVRIPVHDEEKKNANDGTSHTTEVESLGSLVGLLRGGAVVAGGLVSDVLDLVFAALLGEGGG